MAKESAWVETKKPGISRVLMASRSSAIWCGASFPAAYFRFPIKVARQGGGGGRNAGHGMQPRYAQSSRVGKSFLDPRAELFFPAGKAGDAALAGGPVARRHV